ncbi:MAG: dihydroneopterin aldolase [Armatimonadetes bacterium]|nr:dihydroneopterin aldolase [Armatimonadota bacterium]
MTTDRILLEDIRFYGYHGVHEAENRIGHRYSADVEIGTDLARASQSDDVADTVDYGLAVRAVLEEGQGRRYHLIEALAGAIAERVLALDRVEWVRVRVRKEQPPVPAVMASASVEIVRQKEA